MTSEKSDIEKELKVWFSNAERVVVAGIGNPIRMDDSVGIKIIRDLRGKVSEKVCLIECETVPESFIQQIIDFAPTNILLIDAAVLGLKPGGSKIIKPEKLDMFPAFSTHHLPLRMFCGYLSETTKAKIILLLIEPEDVGFGEGLTPKIDATATKIVNILIKVLP